MWEATVDGRRLNFRLSGINNQNFLMHDEETGTWWQQVTGEAILGPLKGRRLNPVVYDEISFTTWKREQPGGRVLRPDEKVAGKYAPANWEERLARMPTVTPTGPDDPLPPRELVIGISVNGESKAYPMSKLQKSAAVLDTLGGVALVIALDDDRQSARVFERAIDGRTLEMFAEQNVSPLQLIDGETGSRWDFSGRAVSGPLAGRQLKKVPAIKDYWFDWRIYNPNTMIY